MGKKFFFDTEFFENGPENPIKFISIGIVSEDGDEYYAVSSEFNEDDLSDWLRENVLPKLEDDSIERKSNEQIAKEIVDFVGEDPEFYANFASYDWVVLCQLYGTMMDLPDTWPMFVRDIQQIREDLNVDNDKLPKQDEKTNHNALSDARHDREVYEFLKGRKIAYNLNRIVSKNNRR